MGDGIPDAQELLAGTDPHDPASYFRISKIDKSATGTQLQFGTAAGKTYRIEYTDDLRSGWQVLLDHIAGTGTLKTLDIPIPANHPQRFYRVVILP